MTAIAPADPGLEISPSGYRYLPLALATSLVAHALGLAVALALTRALPIEPSPPRTVDVQLVAAPPAAAPLPAKPVAALPLGPAPNHQDGATGAALPRPAGPPRAAPQLPADAGMSHPSRLLAQAYLVEPASAQLRRNLPGLAPDERVTQLCNIEAGQQIQAAAPEILVDTVHASALGDTTIDGRSIRAPLAAYRSRRQWYALSFVCTVAPDFKSVTDFRFAVGGAVPRDLWEAHALNATDADE